MNQTAKKLVTASLMKHFTLEEASLLAKAPDRLEKVELLLLAPLSKCNYWLERAKDIALETLAYENSIADQHTFECTRRDVECIMKKNLVTIRLYRMRARAYRAEYRRLRATLGSDPFFSRVDNENLMALKSA